MIRGRKVTDPVVQEVPSYENKQGLSKAWDTVGKAKSELRKAEQRLEEAERLKTYSRLNQTGETSITDYGGLGPANEINTTYSVPEDYASGAVVDNYGRSAYLKSKTQTTRKVSRLDDKYVEENVPKETKKKTSSTSKSHDKHAANAGKKKRVDLQLREKKYEAEPRKVPGTRNTVDRRVEFSDQLHFQDLRYGLDNGVIGDTICDNLSNDQSTFTNSRDIRETEINFLNNDLTCDTDPRLDPSQRLTHVDIKITGGSRLQSSAVNNIGGPESGTGKRSHFLDIVSENPDMEGQPSDCSHSDSESSKGRRFKGNRLNIGAGEWN
ncbi:hypothetical protein ACF0H5_021938 [Mactra antiquata]